MNKPAEVNLGDHIQIETGDTVIPALVTLILEASCEALYIDCSGRVLAEGSVARWRLAICPPHTGWY